MTVNLTVKIDKKPIRIKNKPKKYDIECGEDTSDHENYDSQLDALTLSDASYEDESSIKKRVTNTRHLDSKNTTPKRKITSKQSPNFLHENIESPSASLEAEVTPAKKTRTRKEFNQLSTQNLSVQSYELMDKYCDLYAAITSSTKCNLTNICDELVEDFVSVEHGDENIIYEIVSLIFNCSGICFVREKFLVRSEYPVEIVEKILGSLTEKEIAPIYLFSSKSKEFKRNQKSFCDFFVKLIERSQIILNNDEFMPKLSSWIGSLTSSHLRCLRYVSTVGALSLISGLCSVNQQLREQLQKNHDLSLSNKKKLKHTRDLFDEKHALSLIEVCERGMMNLFNAVFVNRYRDVDVNIRRECISHLGYWCVEYPSTFLENSILRYLGWQLSDMKPEIRLITLESFKKIFGNPENHPRIIGLLERVKGRLFDISLYDMNETVRVASISFLNDIYRSKIFNVEDFVPLRELMSNSSIRIQQGIYQLIELVLEREYRFEHSKIDAVVNLLMDVRLSSTGIEIFHNHIAKKNHQLFAVHHLYEVIMGETYDSNESINILLQLFLAACLKSPLEITPDSLLLMMKKFKDNSSHLALVIKLITVINSSVFLVDQDVAVLLWKEIETASLSSINQIHFKVAIEAMHHLSSYEGLSSLLMIKWKEYYTSCLKNVIEMSEKCFNDQEINIKILTDVNDMLHRLSIILEYIDIFSVEDFHFLYSFLENCNSGYFNRDVSDLNEAICNGLKCLFRCSIGAYFVVKDNVEMLPFIDIASIFIESNNESVKIIATSLLVDSYVISGCRPTEVVEKVMITSFLSYVGNFIDSKLISIDENAKNVLIYMSKLFIYDIIPIIENLRSLFNFCLFEENQLSCKVIESLVKKLFLRENETVIGLLTECFNGLRGIYDINQELSIHIATNLSKIWKEHAFNSERVAHEWLQLHKEGIDFVVANTVKRLSFINVLLKFIGLIGNDGNICQLIEYMDAKLVKFAKNLSKKDNELILEYKRELTCISNEIRRCQQGKENSNSIISRGVEKSSIISPYTQDSEISEEAGNMNVKNVSFVQDENPFVSSPLMR